MHSNRPTPSAEILAWRERRLEGNLALLTPQQPAGDFGLEPGNRKLGQHSRNFDRVFVWNLPAVLTCPGRSEYCVRVCYNADKRADVFPVERWVNNLAAYRTDRVALQQKISSQLEAATTAAVRLHSSGDFFDTDYVQFWIEVALLHPTVLFWAYTRSWTVAKLLEPLEQLRRLANVQLFASWDSTMAEAPAGWRVSRVVVAEDYHHTRGNFDSIVCPEQTGAVRNCAECGYFISKRRGGVIFFLH